MRLSRTALWILVGCDSLVLGCSRVDPMPVESKASTTTAAQTQALNLSPRVSDFALYASNSILIGSKAVVSGGDVGVIASGAGPSLVPGYELAVSEKAEVSVGRTLIADSVLLRSQATTGDVETTQLTDQGASHGSVGAFLPLPAPPTTTEVQVGPADFVVPANTTRTLASGRYRKLVLGANSRLLLQGGVYELAELTLGEKARIEVQASSRLLVAGRAKLESKSEINVAAGSGLTAADVRLEISGANGGSGGLNASPAAIELGEKSSLRALVLAPNGRLQLAEKVSVTGALFARDIQIGEKCNIAYEGGIDGGATNCAPSCDDANPCTTDTCSAGACVHAPLDGTVCDDGNACTAGDACSAGVCAAGPPLQVDDQNPCTLDSCDPALGARYVPVEAGAGCSDSDACNGAETCNGSGQCVAGTPVTCQQLDQCHEAGTCDPQTGACTNPAKPDDIACDDGNLCTALDRCQTGSCVGHSPITCAAQDACHSVGLCDPLTGACSNPSAPDGTGCDDGNLCTQGDSCQSGSCHSGASLQCAGGQCAKPGVCDPASGACLNEPADDGTSCDDGTACTAADICRGGVCIGGNPVVCVAQDECHTAGTCNPLSGACSNPSLPGAVCAALPVDPATIAPPLDQGVALNLFDATTFLYEGENPIQTGVAAGTIDRPRAAVLRGRVLTRAGEPLPGVVVAIKDHAEYGQTRSRADGWFDLVVNGGQVYTVTYKKPGYLPVARHAPAPWLDYVKVDDAALVPMDPAVTGIDLSRGELQVARGSLMIDERGARQLNLLFKPGTRATITPPTCASQELDILHVRTTEYTVGPGGRTAMAAPLPSNSAYTYATEFGVDEAIAAGTMNVDFSEPVIGYLENFLEFPVGSTIPFGLYNRNPARWFPQDNVRVIQVLPSATPLAELDVDGDQVPESPESLAELGITDDERRFVKQTYAPANSLWRAEIPHFSWGDWNRPWGPPPPPPPPPPGFPPGSAWPTNPQPPNPAGAPDCSNTTQKCVIELQKQTLGESVPITGTPFSLVYRSDRVPGRNSELFKIPVSGDTVPPALKAIEVTVTSGGRSQAIRLPPLPNQTFDYLWQGIDAYEREYWRFPSASVLIGYVYDGVYGNTDRFGDPATSEGLIPAGVELSRTQFYRLDSSRMAKAEPWDARGQGLGGWTLNVQHNYDPQNKVLRLGDGGQRSAEGLFPSVRPGAGSGQYGYAGDGGPAKEAALNLNPMLGGEGAFTFIAGVAAAPDGGYYVADVGNCRVRHVDAAGIISTVAGSGNCDFGSVEAEPAPDTCSGIPQPQLDPLALAVDLSPIEVTVAPDGSVYIVSSTLGGFGFGYGTQLSYDALGSKIYRLDPETGTLRRVAGRGFSGTLADGVAATDALLRARDVAVGDDGSVFIADTGNHRIRRVAPGGVITTIAGTGERGLDGDGGIAKDAQLANPTGLTVGPSGEIYVADQGNHRIRLIRPDGTIETIAGAATNTEPSGDEPVQAYGATLDAPIDVALAPDGSCYFAELSSPGQGFGVGLVRRITPGGLLETAAGGGTESVVGGEAATRPRLGPADVDVLGSGSLLVADLADNRIQRVAPPLPGVGYDEMLVPSSDGQQVFVFDRAGRHLRTVHALTGGTLLSFGYDSSGRLATVSDGDGNVTSFERDAQGQPQAVVSPYQQRTNLSVDANGYLALVENPAAETRQMAYSDGGLLAAFTDGRGGAHTYEYDANSSLINATDAASSTLTFARTDLDNAYRVEQRTALGRTTAFEVKGAARGARTLTNTAPDGTQTITQRGTDQSTTTLSPDGSTSVASQLPDPRFGALTPLTESVVSLPSGLTSSSSQSRQVVQTDLDDPLTVTEVVETTELNGAFAETRYDAATRTFTRSSPAGRQSFEAIDERGRILRRDVPGLASTFFDYDGRGRLTSISNGSPVQAASDGGPRVTTFEYDAEGNVQTVAAPLGQHTQLLDYDRAGRAHRQILPGGRTVFYGYDADSNVTSITPPERPAHALNYTPANLMSVYSPPDPVAGDGGTWSTQYAYDADRELDLVTRPDARTIDYRYDDAGRLNALVYPTPGSATATETLSLVYDDAGRVASMTSGAGITLSYGYDGPLALTEAWSGAVNGSVERSYDGNFRVISESVNGLDFVDFQYDEDGFLTRAGALNLDRDGQNGLLRGLELGGVHEQLEYNVFGEPKSYAVDAPGAPGLFSVGYTRDQLGRITEKTELVAGVTTTHAYGYDAAGRLQTASRDGETTSYAYDANGNRTSKTPPSGPSLSAVYDDQDRLLSYASAAFEYTANGELLGATDAAGRTSYSYDVLGNLRSVQLPDGTLIEYLVDGRNRRVAKKVNGSLVKAFLYADALSPIAELDPSGNIVSRFVYGTKINVPEYMLRDGVTYRLVTDHLGSVRLVVNAATGDIAQRIYYDEWGVVLADTAPGFQPFGFAGGLYEPATGLARFGARDYDSGIGRWTAKDPILFAGGQGSLYSYVDGDPINFYDPQGLVDALYRGPGGTVGYVGWQNDSNHSEGLGYFVRVDNADGTHDYIGHLDSAAVRRGQRIASGCAVGVMGNTGHSTGPHVHYARRDRNWIPIDPGLTSPFHDGGTITTHFGVRDSTHPNAHRGTDWIP